MSSPITCDHGSYSMSSDRRIPGSFRVLCEDLWHAAYPAAEPAWVSQQVLQVVGAVNHALGTARLLPQRDFQAGTLNGAMLLGVDMQLADLHEARLRRSILWGAILRGADLRAADLAGADLRRADLWGTVLRAADLRGADLRQADLRRADLRDADLGEAVLARADVARADLSTARLAGAGLAGLFWSRGTIWPAGEIQAITQNSLEIHPGAYRVASNAETERWSYRISA
jgi:hypothetical protein